MACMIALFYNENFAHHRTHQHKQIYERYGLCSLQKPTSFHVQIVKSGMAKIISIIKDNILVVSLKLEKIIGSHLRTFQTEIFRYLRTENAQLSYV